MVGFDSFKPAEVDGIDQHGGVVSDRRGCPRAALSSLYQHSGRGDNTVTHLRASTKQYAT
jgi:hypothetical protein